MKAEFCLNKITDDACLDEIGLYLSKYIAEARLISICPKKLEAKDLKDKLMHNRCVPIFIIGLEILLLTMQIMIVLYK